MPHFKLALLGFGNVGQALAQLLNRKRAELKIHSDITFSITAIATASHGSVIDPHGIDIERAVQLRKSGRSLEMLSTKHAPRSSLELINSCGADVLFENTPVNYLDGQPAVDHLRSALEAGMHAITSNKGAVVHAHRELTNLAASKGRKFYFEATVMDGAPVFSLFRETLPTAQVQSFVGILNSTTNLILTRMEKGEPFEQALAYAQEIGIAETDPSGDIDGWDAAVKVAALVTVLMDSPLKPNQVERQGIRGFTNAEVRRALAQGKRWKLVCAARKEGAQVQAQVAPEMVPPDSLLYYLEGTSSMITFETDVLPSFSVVEMNPTPQTTAYGLLADFINAVKQEGKTARKWSK